MDLVVGPWGARPTDAPVATETTPNDPNDRTFGCGQCGAILTFEPGTKQLTCQYCGHVNAIELSDDTVEEQDLDDALSRIGDSVPSEPVEASCPTCAASFTFEAPLHAGPCPFCDSPVFAKIDDPLPEQGLLPFLVGEPQARERINKWLGRLWFAPSNVKEQTRGRDRLRGYYLPFFTYDADSDTDYTGMRGDVYFQTVRVPVVVDGKTKMTVQQVPKVRWSPARGQVRRQFDDVVISASESQPPVLMQRMRWLDLKILKPVQPEFLAGFFVERQQRSLNTGFGEAVAAMKAQIQADIRRQIGGDQQRITQMQIRFADRRFKLILLPIWVATLGFTGRKYRVLVNGRTGEVMGERPYSAWKIAGAVAVGLIVAAAFAAVVLANN